MDLILVILENRLKSAGYYTTRNDGFVVVHKHHIPVIYCTVERSGHTSSGFLAIYNMSCSQQWSFVVDDPRLFDNAEAAIKSYFSVRSTLFRYWRVVKSLVNAILNGDGTLWR